MLRLSDMESVCLDEDLKTRSKTFQDDDSTKKMQRLILNGVAVESGEEMTNKIENFNLQACSKIIQKEAKDTVFENHTKCPFFFQFLSS